MELSDSYSSRPAEKSEYNEEPRGPSYELILVLFRRFLRTTAAYSFPGIDSCDQTADVSE